MTLFHNWVWPLLIRNKNCKRLNWTWQQLRQNMNERLRSWNKNLRTKSSNCRRRQNISNIILAMQMFSINSKQKKIVILEQQVKDAQIASKASSFSSLTAEEFKNVLCKVHQEFLQVMVNLYTCFDEMQGLYNSFRQHLETLESHHDQTKATSRDFEHVID